MTDLGLLLWTFGQPVDDVRHDVAGQGVAIYLGAALGVQGVCGVAQITEYVEAVEYKREVCLRNALG